MKYSASLHNIDGKLDVLMKVGDKTNTVSIAPKPNGSVQVSAGEKFYSSQLPLVIAMISIVRGENLA